MNTKIEKTIVQEIHEKALHEFLNYDVISKKIKIEDVNKKETNNYYNKPKQLWETIDFLNYFYRDIYKKVYDNSRIFSRNVEITSIEKLVILPMLHNYSDIILTKEDVVDFFDWLSIEKMPDYKLKDRDFNISSISNHINEYIQSIIKPQKDWRRSIGLKPIRCLSGKDINEVLNKNVKLDIGNIVSPMVYFGMPIVFRFLTKNFNKNKDEAYELLKESIFLLIKQFGGGTNHICFHEIAMNSILWEPYIKNTDFEYFKCFDWRKKFQKLWVMNKTVKKEWWVDNINIRKISNKDKKVLFFLA